MKFVVDAQLPPKLAAWLIEEFSVEAVAVRDLGLRDAMDRKIFDAARQAKAVVMTKDSDFVELVYRLGAPPQVVWLTCGNTTNIHLRRLLAATFPDALRLIQAGEVMVEIGDA